MQARVFREVLWRSRKDKFIRRMESPSLLLFTVVSYPGSSLFFSQKYYRWISKNLHFIVRWSSRSGAYQEKMFNQRRQKTCSGARRWEEGEDVITGVLQTPEDENLRRYLHPLTILHHSCDEQTLRVSFVVLRRLPPNSKATSGIQMCLQEEETPTVAVAKESFNLFSSGEVNM